MTWDSLDEEEFAKIAFSKIIGAIIDIKNNIQYQEEIDRYHIQFPGMIMVNNSVYEFRKISKFDTHISNDGKKNIPD